MRQDEIISDRLVETATSQDVIPPEADSELVRRLFDNHAAYKAIQILGQALRNIGGSAHKRRKEEIIDRLIGLARRVLGSYFDLFAAEHLAAIIEDMVAVHKEQQPELTRTELYNQVNQHLCGLSQFVAFAVIKHTTFSIGSENLAPTIERVLGASSEIATRLFGLSFDLERAGRFPRQGAIKLYDNVAKNHFTSGLVRMLVAHHLYLYVVPIDDRQSVCDKMSITLVPTVLDKSRKRLT